MIDSYEEKAALKESFKEAMRGTTYMDATLMREAFEEAVTDVFVRGEIR